jgi:hypothetical protein
MARLLLIAVAVLSATAWAQAPESSSADADAGTPPPPDVSQLPLTSDSIRLVMAYHQPKIQSCYEDFLAARDRPVEGKLMTSFVITAEGLVKKPKVLSKGTTLKNQKLNECVVSVLASMTFPKPKGGHEQPVEYPFNLKAIK